MALSMYEQPLMTAGERVCCMAQANVANYEQSARFYVRALGLNPRAASVWGYLRTSLACAGRMDLMQHVHESDLESLSKELPL